VPGWGSVSTVDERGQCNSIVYDDLLWNALVVERAPKQHNHEHTELELELELELIQTQMTQKPMLRAEVGMRVRCANKTSAECIMRGRGIGQNSRKNCKKRGICG